MSGGGGGEKVACVTGAAGFVASWLVKELLRRGYTVRATVRDLNNPKNTEHLMALEGAEERLHLFQAELLDEGSFDSAINGCRGVFHTASPCVLSGADPQTQILDPAIKGTLNVLASCAKNPYLERVVLTSSIASVYHNDRPKTSDVVVDETWFSDPDHCRREKKWYPLSKTLAEEAAWKFAREKGLDLITIHPGLVLGPLLQPTLNLTSAHVLSLLKGENNAQDVPVVLVHLKDVVDAHIRAYETPSASGRYCLVERVVSYSDVVNILNDLYPELGLQHMGSDDKPSWPMYRIAKEKAKALGVNYTPIEIGFKDIVESLKEKKFISF